MIGKVYRHRYTKLEAVVVNYCEILSNKFDRKGVIVVWKNKPTSDFKVVGLKEFKRRFEKL